MQACGHQIDVVVSHARIGRSNQAGSNRDGDADEAAVESRLPGAKQAGAESKIGLLLVVSAVGLTAAPLAVHAADPKKGEGVYQERCALCHPADGVGQGPVLRGVVGRKAASAPDFPYTDALKASHLTWTPANLSKFLIGPTVMVPGTAMPMTVPDAVERADLIAYLATQK